MGGCGAHPGHVAAAGAEGGVMTIVRVTVERWQSGLMQQSFQRLLPGKLGRGFESLPSPPQAHSVKR